MNGKRILLVEDDEFVRSLVRMQLATLGYEVTCAENATRALERLRTHGPVDLLMTDVTMPGDMDGLRLVANVRQRWPRLPVLVASGDAAHGVAAREVGAPHLQKPYVLAELERKLAEALADGCARDG